MADLNNISVIGRTTRGLDDRAFAYTQNGKARLNISIAVNDGYGEGEYTSFFDVVVWGKTAENIKPYLSKGKQLCVCGRLRQDRWDGNDGAKHSRVVIVAETVQLLGGRDNAAGGNMHQQPKATAENYADAMDDGAGFNDDVPF